MKIKYHQSPPGPRSTSVDLHCIIWFLCILSSSFRTTPAVGRDGPPKWKKVFAFLWCPFPTPLQWTAHHDERFFYSVVRLRALRKRKRDRISTPMDLLYHWCVLLSRTITATASLLKAKGPVILITPSPCPLSYDFMNHDHRGWPFY